MALLLTWILYAFLGVTIFSLIFLWAVRHGQFRDQDRARYLPLHGMEEKHEKEPPAAASADDKEK